MAMLPVPARVPDTIDWALSSLVDLSGTGVVIVTPLPKQVDVSSDGPRVPRK